MTETKYINIPVRSLWSALGLIVASAFTYLQLVHVLIPGFREIFSLKPDQASIGDVLRLMWTPVIAYGLVGLNAYLTVNIFKPLRPYRAEGLVWWLVAGLVLGLVWWLAMGLVTGLVAGLVLGLVEEFKSRPEV